MLDGPGRSAIRSPTPSVGPGTVLVGLRDAELLRPVMGALAASGLDVVDVVGSTADLVVATSDHRPEVVLSSLDVLGSNPERTVKRLVARSSGVAVVVLSPLGRVPLWLLEAGACAVLDQREIGELKRILSDLHAELDAR